MIARAVIKEIADYSPLIATALGSPIAGFVIKFLLQLFHINSIDDLPKLLNSDPTAPATLKKFENENENLLRHYTEEVDDRKDAREVEKLYIQNNKFDYMTPLLVVLLMLGIVAIIACMMIKPANMTSELSMILGILVREVPAVYRYKFGDTGSDSYVEKNQGRTNSR